MRRTLQEGQSLRNGTKGDGGETVPDVFVRSEAIASVNPKSSKSSSVWGGRVKRVKSNRSWVGSVTTIEQAFPMEGASAPQPSTHRAADGYPERPLTALPNYYVVGSDCRNTSILMGKMP
jgi:hypothetical protein